MVLSIRNPVQFPFNQSIDRLFNLLFLEDWKLMIDEDWMTGVGFRNSRVFDQQNANQPLTHTHR